MVTSAAVKCNEKLLSRMKNGLEIQPSLDIITHLEVQLKRDVNRFILPKCSNLDG